MKNTLQEKLISIYKIKYLGGVIMDNKPEIFTFNPETALSDFQAYLYERENAKATISKYMTDIRTFYKYLDRNYQIDKKCIVAYKEWLEPQYEVTSINSMLVALNQFLDFMGFGKWKVKRLKVQKQLFIPEAKEMTKEEYKRLIEAAKSQKKHQLAMSIKTLAATGARVSELMFFTVESVKKGTITISNKGKRRTILIPQILKKELLYFASKNGIVRGCIFVTKNGKPKDRSNLWREMKALCAVSKVPAQKIFPHNLRHLFARSYYKLTSDIAGLADLLGHSSLDVTRIYTANTEETYRNQIQKLGLTPE